MDKVIVAIPSRYGSTRFPGKPLALLAGKPMIQHVCEKAAASRADTVIVATDDARIADAVRAFGGTPVMTSVDHPSGTDRIREAIQELEGDIIINVQGDEPLLPTAVIDELISLMQTHPEYPMATVAVPISRTDAANPNKVKVVFAADGRALYFSRAPIPYRREGAADTPLYWHWGIYAYRRRALDSFVARPPGRYEECEKLEQLRALENGLDIHVITTQLQSIGVDTPEDLAEAERYLKENL